MRRRGQDEGKRRMEVGLTSGAENYVIGQTQAGGHAACKQAVEIESEKQTSFQ